MPQYWNDKMVSHGVTQKKSSGPMPNCTGTPAGKYYNRVKSKFWMSPIVFLLHACVLLLLSLIKLDELKFLYLKQNHGFLFAKFNTNENYYH